MNSPGELSCQSSLPVLRSRAMKLGALFAMRGPTRPYEMPFDVLTNKMSPAQVTEQLLILRGNTPSRPIMSNFQTTSASSLALLSSVLNGPSFSLSRKPSTSRQTTSQRLLTYQSRLPETYGVEQTPCIGQSFTRPMASLRLECCQRNAPSDSRKQTRQPRSTSSGNRLT